MLTQLAVIGLGKIARDSHLPAIAKSGAFELAAAVDPSGQTLSGIPLFETCDELLASYRGKLDAAVLCTPPGPRFLLARKCLEAGLHVLLEKPPAATLGEASFLLQLAEEKNVTVLGAWHHRYNRAVEQARTFVRNRRVASFEVRWVEDWHIWHPGQDWVWEPNGMGVFDAGINALSLLTYLRDPILLLTRAEFFYPGQKAAPIRAELDLNYSDGCGGKAFFDWTGAATETRTIKFELCDGGRASLENSGRTFALSAQTFEGSGEDEYEGVYRRFSELISARRSDLDFEALRVTADAFLIARHQGTTDRD